MDSEIIQIQKFILRIEFNDIKFNQVVDNQSIKIEDLKKLIFQELQTLTPDNLIPEQYIITNNSGIELSPSDILSNLVQNNDILKVIKKVKQQQDKMEEEKQGQLQQQQNQQIQADPQEAIIVLMNCSKQMEQLFSNEDKITRKEAVFILFTVYLDKLISFKLNHVVKLICFSRIIKQKGDYTKNFNNLQNVQIEIQSVTDNRLYDVLQLSVGNLSYLRQQKYPNIKLRIIALTDGDDNISAFKPDYVIKNIIQNQIVLDSFIVGENSTVLKNMSHASGGLCFNPTTLEKGLQLFEHESILSISLRHKIFKPTVDANFNLQNTDTLFDTEEQQVLKPDDFQKPVISVEQMITNIENDKQQQQEQSQKSNGKRILQELLEIQKNPIQDLKVSIFENDMFFWKITLQGPVNTPYAGGIFQLFAIIPTDYPFKPPQVNFITKIYHCNISKQGSICLDILYDKWSQTLTIQKVITAIIQLLENPNQNAPLDNEIALIYKQDKSKYEQIATEWTKKYAI